MNENLRSILTGTAALTVGAVVSLVLTILRQPQGVGREQTVRVFIRAGGSEPAFYGGGSLILRTGFPPCSAFRRGQKTFLSLSICSG
jgi:hypothetical protein